MLKTILVATDGSDHAEKAIDWAVELAAAHDAGLVLLYVAPHKEVPPELRRMAEVEHIVEPEGPSRALPEASYPSASIGRPDLQQALVNSARIYQELGEQILDAGKNGAERRGVKSVQVFVEHGDPAHQIIQAAERHHADLIVMGRRGFGDLKGLLLGSVSHKVCQLANCACLTVR